MKLLNHLVLFSTLASGQQAESDLQAEIEALYEDISGLDPRGRNKQQAIANGTYKKPANKPKPTNKPTKKPTKKPTNKPTKPSYTTKQQVTTQRTTVTTTRGKTTTKRTTPKTTTEKPITQKTTTKKPTTEKTTKGNPYAAGIINVQPAVTTESTTQLTTTPADNRNNMKEIYELLTGSSWNGPSADDVFNYGCWCNMNNGLDHVQKGKGQPLDAIDEACQAWHRCTTCIRMDDTDCVPLNEKYDFLTGSKYNPQVSCTDNPSGCADWSCQCDVHFVKSVIDLINQDQFQPTLSHTNKSWNSGQCKWEGNFETQDECCGEFPSRFPFASNFGSRACCGNKTYQTETHDCCDGDKIRLRGQCGGDKPPSQPPSNPYGSMGAFAPAPAAVMGAPSFCVREDDQPVLEIVFLVDISSSIAPKVQNGMGGLWKWLNGFTHRFNFSRQAKMALITYNSDATVEVVFLSKVLSITNFQASLGHYSPQKIDEIMTGVIKSIKPVEESSLNFALKTARKEFKHNGMPEADKAIVLVTDGWSTDTNTPYYHSNLAVREGKFNFQAKIFIDIGIDIFTVGFGPVLNKEYLYTTTMGKEENIHAAADITDLHSSSLMLQEQVKLKTITKGVKV